MSDLAVVRSDETQWTQVDTESTEQFIAEKHIGERIRRLRLKKSMGLVELGRHTGLSASFLSQLETGRVVPTLRNLARIHRRKERVRLPQSGVETPAYFFESLGYMVPDRHMDPYFAEFVPLEAGQEPKAHMHTGFEFLYVLDGELGLRHGTEDCVLAAGDAVYFDASTTHSYHCASKKPAQAIIVTMHQPPPLPTRGASAPVAPKSAGGAAE